MSPVVLALLGLAAVLVILALIIKGKAHPFLAMLCVSVALALVAGVPLGQIVPMIQEGMGTTLGSVALIVALGAMLGRIVEISGGADVLARALQSAFGPRRAPWALGAASFLFGIPVFVDVATIVLVPIVLAVARRTSSTGNMLTYALPAVAALLTVHVAMPPHPGIVGAAGLMSADVGMVLMVALVPSVVMWAFGQWLSGVVTARVYSPIPDAATAMRTGEGASHAAGSAEGAVSEGAVRRPPSFAAVLSAILLPLVLIMGGTVSVLLLPEGNVWRAALGFLGASPMALLLSVLYAIAVLGLGRGWSMGRVEEVVTSALPATAAVILITGAGGTFGAVLRGTGVADAVADLMVATGLPILLLAWLLAALIRAAQGSATVAALTTAPLIAPIATGQDLSVPQIALVTAMIGIGSMALSHVNDSLFWVWSRYFAVGTAAALRSYTVTTTAMSIVGALVCFIMWPLVGMLA